MADINITVTPPPEINIVASPVAVSIEVAAAHTHPQSEITDLVSDLAGKQPLDADLTSIAALDKTGNALKVVRVNAGETAYELATVSGGTGGEPSDGDKGDIVVSGSGATWSIDTAVLTTFGRSLIDDVDASAARTTLGLGTAAVEASSAFAAASHSHAISDVTNLQTTLDGKAASSHTHAQSEITDLVADLAAKAAAVHTHIIGDTTGLQTALDGKAASSHTHIIDDVTGLLALLDSLAADIGTLQTGLTGKQDVDADLTSIAGLTPANDDFIQRKSGAWANRTIAQIQTDLGLTGTNSGDVSLAGTPDYITISGQTITRGQIDLTADVTGILPHGNLGTGGGGATKFLREDGTFQTIAAGGDVTGPASSTDNGLPRFDGTGGKTLQTSVVTVDDDGELRTANNGGANVGVVPAVHFAILDADYALTNSADPQQIFNATTNGRLTLPAGTYLFDALIYIRSMSANSGNCSFSLVGSGTATLDTARSRYQSYGTDATNPESNSSRNGFLSANGALNLIVQVGTNTSVIAQLRGTFTLSAGGTLIPTIALADAAAAVVQEGTYFTCERIGAANVTSVGAWD